MNELDNAVKLLIINKKLKAFENTYYDASLELGIAENLGQERISEKVLKQMAEYKKSMDWLEGEKAKLEKEVEDFVSEQ